MDADRPDRLPTAQDTAPAALLDDLLAQVTQCAVTLEAIQGRLQAVTGPTGPAPLLTVAEAAEHLRISTKHLYKMVKEKRVPYSRVGAALRFSIDSLDQWVRDREVPWVR